jgi:hypothetical protein
MQWAGETVAQKLERMRTQIRGAKADVLLVSMLDEVREGEWGKEGQLCCSHSGGGRHHNRWPQQVALVAQGCHQHCRAFNSELMSLQPCDHHQQVLTCVSQLHTSCAQVAWLLNLRGSDVSYNPVFVSYALVGVDGSASLYVDPAKVTPEVSAHLQVGAGRGGGLNQGVRGLGMCCCSTVSCLLLGAAVCTC